MANVSPLCYLLKNSVTSCVIIKVNMSLFGCKNFNLHLLGSFFFLSLYTARPSSEYYRHVYFVHPGLQDESLQVTISKLQ